MLRRIALLLCPLLLCLFVSSCIDGKEEIWLNADGSGKAEFTYEIPASAAAFKGGAKGVDELIAGLLEGHPRATHSTVKDGDRLKIFVHLPFNSPQELQDLAGSEKSGSMPESFKSLAGTVDFKQSGRTIDISRTINPGRALPGARFYPESQLKGRQLNYIVHLPIPASGSNATRTEDSNRTLIWEVPLSKALRGPITTEFQAVIPIPPSWLLPLGIGLLIIGFGIFLLVRKLRNRKSRIG